MLLLPNFIGVILDGCVVLLSDQLCSVCVCVGLVNFLTNETDVKVFFHRVGKAQGQKKMREVKKEKYSGAG